MMTPGQESALVRMLGDHQQGRLINITGRLLTKNVMGGQTVLGTRSLSGFVTDDDLSGYCFGPCWEACSNPIVFRMGAGDSLNAVTALIGAVTVLTSATTVTNRWRNIRIDENGCIFIGEPYCEASETCTSGSGPEDVAYWCLDGICYTVYDGIAPEGMFGPYDTSEECATACVEYWCCSPASSSSVPEGDLMGCTPFCPDPQTPLLASITIAGGHYDGQTFEGTWNWLPDMGNGGNNPSGPGYQIDWSTGNTAPLVTGFGLALRYGIGCGGGSTPGSRGGQSFVFNIPPHDTVGHDYTDGTLTENCIDSDEFTLTLLLGHDGTGLVTATIVASVITSPPSDFKLTKIAAGEIPPEDCTGTYATLEEALAAECISGSSSGEIVCAYTSYSTIKTCVERGVWDEVTTVFGRYDTMEECEEGCDDEPPVVTCAEVSGTLKVTYGALVFNIVNDGFDTWSGTTGPSFNCTDGAGVSIACVDSVWTIANVASWCGPATGPATPLSGVPFLLEYDGPGVDGGGSPTGTISLTITEV